MDIGRQYHHVAVVDTEGERLLSRRVANDETALLEVIGQVMDVAGQVTWAIDLNSSESALLLTLLLDHDQRVVYVPGMTVNRAAEGYKGAGKTDAKDALIIADQARMRRDLTILDGDDELIVELRLLVARRRDLAADRTRAVNRLHDQLLAICPALERALELTNQGPLVLLTGFQTPAALREIGIDGLTDWLRARKVRSAAALAAKAAAAAATQHTTLPGEQMAARLVAQLAEGVITLNEQLKDLDQLIEDRFRRHPSAEVIISMPGIGVLLGAEFLAATGGDMDRFASADQLASFAGVTPVPRDSGRVHGNLHRPQRYNRALQRVFYTSALISIQSCPDSRRFYDRKRTEGKRHTQAVLALARRRVNVLWALLRDGRVYQLTPPLPAAA
ncbi:IS110 family RNA-guided transposase [Actinomadura luteofluorescens]|uniref:Transposase n=1 Tax=Actinomadura luteofluorescens TaxID=46163 RepID=A0A7Y9EQB8_9ACTN|nr:IS110 family transposase [Actinomadura luteofluorescens]NYD48251.1 transposase [Actinomadura luteofluorescens]NYD51844.1 transposase [Actinomadura luteofluorescens]